MGQGESGPGPRPSSGHPDLVGRADELARVHRMLDGDGRPCLFVHGEPGVGKSALLREAAQAARRRGHRVMSAAGVLAESTIAYAGLHQLLGPLVSQTTLDPARRATFGAAFGSTVAVHPPSVMELGVAVLDLLMTASRAEPLLLTIDDLQWFDLPSTEVILFAARRLAHQRTRLVLTVRDGDVASLDSGGLPELLLEPLTVESAAQLLTARHPRLGAASRQLVLSTARGNPLALEELPRCLDAEGVGTAYLRAGATLPLNRRLEQLYAHRIECLSDEERDELLVAALDGPRTAGSNGVGRYRLRHSAAAEASGLVDLDRRSGRATFRHPLVRSAVVQMATPNAVGRAHQRLAGHYVDDVERRAGHLAAATVDPDEAVAGLLEDAARSAVRRGGSGVGIDWLTRAAELSGSARQRSRRLAEASLLAGQSGLLAQSSALHDAAGSQAAATPTSVLSDGYLALYREGDVVGTHRRVTATLGVHGHDLDDSTLDRLVQLLLVLAQFAADPDVWRTTDAVVDRHAARLSAATHLFRDSWGDVVRRGRTVADRLAAAFADLVEDAPWDCMRLAVCAYSVDTLSDYRPFLERMVRKEQATGAITPVMTMLHLGMLDDLSTGAWVQAERTGRRALALTSEHGYDLLSHQIRATLGVLAAQRGDVRRAEELQATIGSWGRSRGIGHLVQSSDVIGVRAAITTADYESAWTYATRITLPGTFPAHSPRALSTLFDLVEAAVHTGRHAAGQRHLDAALELGLDELSPRLSLAVAGARALLAEVPEAPALFEVAVDHPATRVRPFERARLRLAYGMWLRRHRRVSAARTVLADAADTFAELGATTWHDRARDETASTGSTRLHPDDRLDTLTPQERLVAELAASGLSNKQIGAQLSLSPRTVGAHLYRSFPKLGVTSRAALRDVLGDIARPR
jgi:DNA-binding NarL/FixJ family response regulator